MDLSGISNHIADAPRSQLDDSVRPKLRAVKTADDLKAVLDECAYASLASDFVMSALDTIWRQMQSTPPIEPVKGE